MQAAVDQRLKRRREAVDLGELGDEARGAVVDALQRDLHIGLAGDDADALRGRGQPHGLQRRDAAAVGQAQVEQHHLDGVGGVLLELAQGGLQRVGLGEARGRIQAADGLHHAFTDEAVVINQQVMGRARYFHEGSLSKPRS